jgi:hypothetical protein
MFTDPPLVAIPPSPTFVLKTAKKISLTTVQSWTPAALYRHRFNR